MWYHDNPYPITSGLRPVGSIRIEVQRGTGTDKDVAHLVTMTGHYSAEASFMKWTLNRAYCGAAIQPPSPSPTPPRQRVRSAACGIPNAPSTTARGRESELPAPCPQSHPLHNTPFPRQEQGKRPKEEKVMNV